TEPVAHHAPLFSAMVLSAAPTESCRACRGVIDCLSQRRRSDGSPSLHATIPAKQAEAILGLGRDQALSSSQRRRRKRQPPSDYPLPPQSFPRDFLIYPLSVISSRSKRPALRALLWAEPVVGESELP